MINFKTDALLALKDEFASLVGVAQDAMSEDPDQITRELTSYSRRGVTCTRVFDDEDLIGYVLHGPAEKFVDWTSEMPLRMKLHRDGIGNIHTLCHLYVRKAYWQTGIHRQLAREYSQLMMDEGARHMLLWGYATDELASYALSQPGSKKLKGMKDPGGRAVGVRDLSAFLKATAPLQSKA